MLLVPADGQLQVPGRDALRAVLAGDVAGELEHLGAEILHRGRQEDACSPANSTTRRDVLLEVAVDPSHGEVHTSAYRTRSIRVAFLLAIFTIFAIFAIFVCFPSFEWHFAALRFHNLVVFAGLL